MKKRAVLVSVMCAGVLAVAGCGTLKSMSLDPADSKIKEVIIAQVMAAASKDARFPAGSVSAAEIGKVYDMIVSSKEIAAISMTAEQNAAFQKFVADEVRKNLLPLLGK